MNCQGDPELQPCGTCLGCMSTDLQPDLVGCSRQATWLCTSLNLIADLHYQPAGKQSQA